MLVHVDKRERLALLLQKVAREDMTAFRALYDEVAGAVLAVATRILRDPQTSEDAAQEAFVRIWRNAAKFDPERGTAMSWISVIARNAAFDLVPRRLPPEMLEAADTIELAEVMVDPPDAKLGQCLDRLPRDQAHAIVVMYTYGLSHSELAQRLGVPLGTVKSKVRRGMAKLQECMLR
jgi:RNA polymerase sigma-70 factor (ECF subfamily)